MPSTSGNFLSDFGVGGWLQLGGSLMSAVGGYYAAESQKSQLKSQALSLEHEASMSRLNARMAENDAQAIEEAGREEAGQVALRYAQEKGAYRASVGASGIVAGFGSTAEVAASIDLAAEVDALTINRNAVRAAGARRVAATDLRNRGAMAEISAGNVRATAGSIRPRAALAGSLLSSSGMLASQWTRRGY